MLHQALFGGLLERFILRALAGNAFGQVLVTLGVALIMREIANQIPQVTGGADGSPAPLRTGENTIADNHLHHLGVTGQARTHFFVRRVRRESSGVSDGGRIHAWRLPELALGAPETAEAEHRLAQVGGKRTAILHARL